MSSFNPASILDLPRDDLAAFQESLSDLLATQSDGGIATVREVRDGFSKINNSVKAGSVKVIGRASGEQTVLLSISQLADMLTLVSGQLTFGESLAMAGFKGGWAPIEFDEALDAEEAFDL